MESREPSCDLPRSPGGNGTRPGDDRRITRVTGREPNLFTRNFNQAIRVLTSGRRINFDADVVRLGEAGHRLGWFASVVEMPT
ncbi:MAG: hypothetical protein EA381_20135 [Planctomycetaceae bacterium]|nr:MAG: hypothetical protein EA381_20135 [Planctomycetaceae bacterium]